MWNRREFLAGATLIGGGLMSPLLWPRWARSAPFQPAALPAGTLVETVEATLPGKAPLLKRSFRPPNYETPLSALGDEFTSNEAFFVRYHLSSIPAGPEAGPTLRKAWRLAVGGDGIERPAQLSLDDLAKHFPHVEIAALCLCAGNRRGLFSPHVPGVQWGFGAMGNARWKGVRLRDVLRKAGVKDGAVEVAFNGADQGTLAETPDFVKSLPTWKALDQHTLLCWEMNGKPLPRYNGFPLRLVAPGWAATYWMKHVQSIEVRTQPLGNFWMKTAYRIPRGKFPVADRFPSQQTEANTPITELVVNSLITSLHDGDPITAGQPMVLRGVAWDGGHGIQKVELAIAPTDNSPPQWRRATLGPDHGKFSWRTFKHALGLPAFGAAPGPCTVLCRATSIDGTTQPAEAIANPAGYHHNAIQKLALTIVEGA